MLGEYYVIGLNYDIFHHKMHVDVSQSHLEEDILWSTH